MRPLQLARELHRRARGQRPHVSIAEDDGLPGSTAQAAQATKTRTGRAKARKRVGLEHRRAHLARTQRCRARYRGVRTNLFDLRRACAVQNFETIQRKQVMRSISNQSVL